MKNQKHLKPDSEFSYVMWIPVVGLFDRVFNKQSPIRLYGGPGWSRTNVLGFSVRRANRVRHRPIFDFFYQTQKKELWDLNPTTHCLTDNCSTI